MAKSNIHLIQRMFNPDDEFYTLYEDIEAEINLYDPNHFKDKVVYLNCDDYRWSNFWRFFKDNFERLGLRKLISTHYIDQQLSLFNPAPEKPVKAVYDGRELKTEEIRGDGDYKSEEFQDIYKEADIIVTNPPFSLFCELRNFLISLNKKFILLGTLLKIDNDFSRSYWLGYNSKNTKAQQVSFIRPDGSQKKVGLCCWYTNLRIENYEDQLWNQVEITKKVQEQMRKPKIQEWAGLKVYPYSRAFLPDFADKTPFYVPITFVLWHDPRKYIFHNILNAPKRDTDFFKRFLVQWRTI